MSVASRRVSVASRRSRRGRSAATCAARAICDSWRPLLKAQLAGNRRSSAKHRAEMRDEAAAAARPSASPPLRSRREAAAFAAPALKSACEEGGRTAGLGGVGVLLGKGQFVAFETSGFPAAGSGTLLSEVATMQAVRQGGGSSRTTFPSSFFVAARVAAVAAAMAASQSVSTHADSPATTAAGPPRWLKNIFGVSSHSDA